MEATERGEAREEEERKRKGRGARSGLVRRQRPPEEGGGYLRSEEGGNRWAVVRLASDGLRQRARARNRRKVGGFLDRKGSRGRRGAAAGRDKPPRF